MGVVCFCIIASYGLPSLFLVTVGTGAFFLTLAVKLLLFERPFVSWILYWENIGVLEENYRGIRCSSRVLSVSMSRTMIASAWYVITKSNVTFDIDSLKVFFLSTRPTGTSYNVSDGLKTKSDHVRSVRFVLLVDSYRVLMQIQDLVYRIGLSSSQYSFIFTVDSPTYSSTNMDRMGFDVRYDIPVDYTGPGMLLRDRLIGGRK
jgi:hypothetical protein